MAACWSPKPKMEVQLLRFPLSRSAYADLFVCSLLKGEQFFAIFL